MKHSDKSRGTATLISSLSKHIHEIVVPHILHFRSHPIVLFSTSPAPPSAHSPLSFSSPSLQSFTSFDDFFRRRLRMPYSLRQHSKGVLLVSSGCLDAEFFPDFDFRSSRLPHKIESFSRSDARVSASVRRLRGKN